MNNIIFGLFKIIFGTKFGYLLAIGIVILFGGSLIKNIFNGSFSVTKFFSGFNPFSGGVQGKLIYYALIAFGCFLVYSFVMRPTYDYNTDYKNQIKNNEDVILDQRVGATCIPTKILWGLIQFGCNSEAVDKNVTNNCDCNCPIGK